MDILFSSIAKFSSLPASSVIGVTAAIGFVNYYFLYVVKVPKIHCKEGSFKNFIRQNVPVATTKYWPTMWCFEARFQSVLASLIRSFVVPKAPYNREIFQLTDGGEVALDWLEPTKHFNDMNDITILFLPGLTGDSKCEYVRATSLTVQKSGFRVVVFNYRGIGGIELKTPRTYSANNIDDLTEVIIHIKKKYPNTILGGIGVSMGGLLLGSFLQSNEQHTHKHFSAVMLLSVPWDLLATTRNIEKPFLNRCLCSYLAKCLCNLIKNSSNMLNSSSHKWNYNEVIKSKTIREFDANYTIKLFEHESVEEYYKKASLHDKLDLIQVPCLCLSAADDPFCLESDLPLKSADNIENLAILVTARGGHIGFLEGFWPFSNHNEFMFRLIDQYFSSIFKNQIYKQFTK
ncbi:protein ABHD1-like [Sipha flava]|uniref:Protein ABHD1-like n=2 Tax=Sipha flava TaxID=143950 RepID=A0A8B8FWX1_9HEMI|nr:protein ABHD1-like [Sipha flava]XP_025414842.1 protein ABHD1-like [Sipha flava]